MDLITKNAYELRQIVRDKKKNLQKDRYKDKELEKKGKERKERQKERGKDRERVEKDKERGKHHTDHIDDKMATDQDDKAEIKNFENGASGGNFSYAIVSNLTRQQITYKSLHSCVLLLWFVYFVLPFLSVTITFQPQQHENERD